MNFVMTEEKVTRTYKVELEGFNYRVNKEIKDEKVISMNMDIQGENGWVGNIYKTDGGYNININDGEDLIKHYQVFLDFVSNLDEVEEEI